MMTLLKVTVFLMYLLVGKIESTAVHQERAFISANVGDNVTLNCFYDTDTAKYYWYKQTLGRQLQLISTTYKFDKDGIFHNDFRDNPRFTLETAPGKNHLMITDLQPSDSATYFCASGYSYMFEFGNGSTVSVMSSGLHIPALVYQPDSETIQPGGSVTLNCTVQTGTCNGEHSVYWFKDSVESNPGIIYTQGDKNNHCERKPESQKNTCVYNLPMKNLTHSHAGTYYCAVASCGHILFGNGTKLDVHEDQVTSNILVYFLSGAVAFTGITSMALAFLVCTMNKTDCCKCSAELTSRSTNPEVCQDADSLHYAALSVNLPNRSKRQRNNTTSECVYSSVKQQN